MFIRYWKTLLRFIDDVINGYYHVIVVDPDKSNTQAIKCYEKSGFLLSDYSEDNQHIIMIKKQNKLQNLAE